MNNLEIKVQEFLDERGWGPNPSQLARSISIEAAELLEIFQWEDPIFPSESEHLV